MTTLEAKRVSLFFFFATQDELLTYELSVAACDRFQKLEKRFKNLNSDQRLVLATQQIILASYKTMQRHQSLQPMGSHWIYPQGVDFSIWKEFQKLASPAEYHFLIWSQILKISDSDLATSLLLTHGTLRYRLSIALQKIGSLSRLIPKKFEIIKDPE